MRSPTHALAHAAVIVVGAGPAGLASALALCQVNRSAIGASDSSQRRSSSVLETGRYRNDYTAEAHNVPGFDGKSPTEIRQAIRRDISKFGDLVTFRSQYAVRSISKVDGRFLVNDGDVAGKRVILATGGSDVFPDISGFAELWGKRIFHCPFCALEQRRMR